MANEYLKLWMSYADYFQPLGDAEVGRLVLAMMKYKSTGVEPEFSGNERFVWPAIRRDIDEAKAAQERFEEKQRDNGKNGGRPPKTQAFSEKPTETQKTQAFSEKPTETQKTQAFSEKPKKAKDKGQWTKDNIIPPVSPNGDTPPAGGPKKHKPTAESVIESWTQDAELRNLLFEWLDVRKAQRAANTEGAIKQNLAKLPELAQQSGLSMQDYVREIIRRSWRAFYPIRDAQPRQTQRNDGRDFDWLTGQ